MGRLMMGRSTIFIIDSNKKDGDDKECRDQTDTIERLWSPLIPIYYATLHGFTIVVVVAAALLRYEKLPIV